MMRAYHFTGSTLRGGSPLPPIGGWLEYEGQIVPCESGLHASEHPFDALRYAPGSLLHLIELEGDLQPHGDPIDKWVGRRRKILVTIDASKLLREFARWCARQVLHLWDAPQVVKDYLAIGDESLRAAAEAAAWAARDVAWAAAGDATDAVAWAAAWAAAEAATDAVAWAAAWDAAWAARDAAEAAAWAARDVAWAAAWAAAEAAARAAAWAAAEAAAWAARDAQRTKFAEIVEAALDAAKEGK